MLFAAKCYWPGVTEGELAARAARAARATRVHPGRRDVAYLGSLLFAADDLVLCLFEGPSRAAVKRAADRAGIPCERAALGIEVMRHGKDFMVDKPGVTSFEQLAAVRTVQAETKRIFSICYSEHFETRSTVKAGELVQAGSIGRVIHTTGLGPHRLNKATRPDWFFLREKYGGILTDIASHQCEQFLFLTGADDAKVIAATVANRANPENSQMQDFGEMLLQANNATGYIRVDWFTPDGLPTWGDGRLFIVGTEGSIEVRKFVDIGGAPGIDHLILVDHKGVQRIDCSSVRLPYGDDLIHDILTRDETAMPQARCFKAMELALTAQAIAEKRRC